MEADISIWRKTGHFYFALTRGAVTRGRLWRGGYGWWGRENEFCVGAGRGAVAWAGPVGLAEVLRASWPDVLRMTFLGG
jgi:hypothetical protein